MNIRNQEKQWLLEEKYKGFESPDFFADLEKLESGTPLAYLIGNQPFLGTTILLDSKPLIPRPETEYFVDFFIKNELNPEIKSDILDIFAGSGCIGIGILHNTSNTHVDFAEIKDSHCVQIEKNLHVNNIEQNRYKIFQSDIFSNIPQKTYDHIIANPPYISLERKDTVEDSVLRHEDHLALFAENNGLFFIEKLLKESRKFLKETGTLYIECDPWQKDLIENICKENNISNTTWILDQYKKNRFIKIRY